MKSWYSVTLYARAAKGTSGRFTGARKEQQVVAQNEYSKCSIEAPVVSLVYSSTLGFILPQSGACP